MSLLVMSSCKKTENSPSNSAQNKSNNSKIEGVTNSGGILIFSDSSILQSTINGLISAKQSAEATFSAQFDSSATDSLVKARALAQGYDENQTYLNFESSLSFHSMRIDFDNMLTAWGTNGLTDDDPNNPFIYYSVNTAPILTVLNSAGAVGIGTKLYKIMRNGVVYEITDGSVTTLNNITDTYMDKQYTASNVVIHNTELLGQRNSNKKGGTGKDCVNDRLSYQNYANVTGNGHCQDIISVRNYTVFKYAQVQGIEWTYSHGSWNQDWARISVGNIEDPTGCNESVGAAGSFSTGYIWCTRHTHWLSPHVLGPPVTVQLNNFRTNTDITNSSGGSHQHFTTYLQ